MLRREPPDAPPAIGRALPYRYGRVVSREAYRYDELPDERDRERIERGEPASIAAERLDGDYFVAIDDEVTRGDRAYVRTVSGDYLDAEHVADTPRTALRGAMLDRGRTLPLAFVIDPAVPTFRVGAELSPFGVAEKYAITGAR